MKICYITTYSSTDRRNWSGTADAIRKSIEMQGADVVCLGPLHTHVPRLLRFQNRVRRFFEHGRVELERYPEVSRGYASQIQDRLPVDTDVILSPGSLAIAQLETRTPVVIYSDATFSSFLDHYGQRSQYSPSCIRAGEALERAAYKRASLIVFASTWAAQSAITDYGVAERKVRVIPFGANLYNAPDSGQVKNQIRSRSRTECHLLSIGTDWQRKGMDRSVQLVSKLRLLGIDAKLTIVGSQPAPDTILPDFVRCMDFIDKTTDDGERQLSHLFSEAHFHVLLSRAEAYGIVFAEASAHGTPNIAYDVGGISTAVKHGRNGYLFAQHENESTIAQRVAETFLNTDKYNALCFSSRREFENCLNWTVAGQSLMSEIRQIHHSTT